MNAVKIQSPRDSVTLSPCHRVTLSALAVATLLAFTGCNNNSQGPGGMPAPKPPEVTVSAVKSETVTDYEDFPGRLEAVNSIEIRARVTGFLTKVNFEEGGTVQEGSTLFEIDPAPYQ